MAIDPLGFIKAANDRAKKRLSTNAQILAQALEAGTANPSPSMQSAASPTGSSVVPMSGGLAPSRKGFINPLAHYTITDRYGPRQHPVTGQSSFHTGEDLAAKMGTPVYAVADGVVSKATPNGGAYGNQVVVSLGGGLASMYGHLEKYTVKAGQKVRKGQVIGYVGSTGLSTGPHLHYEIQRNGKPIDPNKFLN